MIEAHENYQKQSYRNRCYILGAEGPEMLQVPIVHGREAEPLSSASLRDPVRANAPERGSASLPITAVKVDYSTPWILRTERALATAYESSAFFEYYADELFALLESRPQTLWELNLGLVQWCFQKMHLGCSLKPTSTFCMPETVADDYRYSIHPKKADTVLEDLGLKKPYYQVFRDRLGGFTPGLCILDLLFNEGPDSIEWLIRL